MTQTDRQRARLNGAERRTLADLAGYERERRAERLIAEVLSLLSQRDVLVSALEKQAGRCLIEVRSLRWPGARATATACGLTLHEAGRLQRHSEDGATTTVGDHD